MIINVFKQPILLFTAFFVLSCSCKKEKSDASTANEESVTGKPTNPPPPTVHGICDFDLNETALTNAGWVKTFEDNFEADLSKWNTWTGGAFNNELQFYQAANLGVNAGNLVIAAKQDTVSGPTTPFDPTVKTFNYTSGRIESKTNISASANTPKVRMIARIKLPSGYGMWPAFWSYGDPWPKQGEIDILEARGQEGFKYQTNYFYGTGTRNLVRGAEGYITADVSLQTCYHVYEVIWSQNSLQFYFDGVLVKTNSSGYVPDLFGKTERITLNLAVGGNFFSNLNTSLIVPGTMYVDWVKVFTSN